MVYRYLDPNSGKGNKQRQNSVFGIKYNVILSPKQLNIIENSLSNCHYLLLGSILTWRNIGDLSLASELPRPWPHLTDGIIVELKYDHRFTDNKPRFDPPPPPYEKKRVLQSKNYPTDVRSLKTNVNSKKIYKTLQHFT